MRKHFIGEEFKDKIIPHAVDYFTGKALDYEDFEEDDDFEVSGILNYTLYNTHGIYEIYLG